MRKSEAIILFFSSILFFLYLFSFSPLLTPKIIKEYKQLPKNIQRDWDIRYESTFFSLIAVIFAYILLIKNNELWKNPVTYHNYGTCGLIIIALSYFIIDLYVTFRFSKYDTLILIHHIVCLISILVALLSGYGHFFIVFLLLSEATTPFMNIRWYLEQLNQKDTTFYLINGILITFFWIIFRFFLFLLFFFVLYTHHDQFSIIHTPITQYIIILFLYCVPFMLFVFNTYWLVKILRGVYKICQKARNPSV